MLFNLTKMIYRFIMNNNKNKFFSFLSVFLLLPINAYAYFDPGTGSYIIQIILAFLASCYFFITNPIKFIKNYFKKIKKKSKDDNLEEK